MSGGFPDMSVALFLIKISQLAFAICEISALDSFLDSEKSNDIYWGYSESDQSDFHKNFFYFKINPIIIGTL